MKFNRAPLLLALPVLLLASACGGTSKRCEPIPGISHRHPMTNGQLSATGQGAAPGPDWLWLDGCWYWNDTDWVWLEQQWMPPGSRMEFVGPEGSRDNYCVFSPAETYVLPVAMPWPPDLGYGRSSQHVIVHGNYDRPPGQWGTGRGPIRDHRGQARRNEVVPATRGKARTPVRPTRPSVLDEPYLGPSPVVARPPAKPPVSRPDPRPTAPDVGPAKPPVVVSPPRPSAPPQGPAAPPPDRIRHDPPVKRPTPSPPARPSAPRPGPAKPTPPRPAPPRAAPRPPSSAPKPSAPARPARPAAPPSNDSRGRGRPRR